MLPWWGQVGACLRGVQRDLSCVPSCVRLNPGLVPHFLVEIALSSSVTQLGVLVVLLSKGSLSSDSDKVGSGCLGRRFDVKASSLPLITEVRLCWQL